MNIEQTIAKSLNISPAQVSSALSMLQEGATIPFIARYRKEQTGALDEDALRAIEQAFAYQSHLAERKEAILGLLEEKKLLSKDLRAAVEQSETLAALEEVYRPYKEKRKTKASEAIANGFGPLADKLWKQNQVPETLGSPADLEQAGYILAEKISEDPNIRSLVREDLLKNESLTSTKKKDAEDPQGIYENYYEFSNPLRSIPPHRVLGMERGEKEKVLTLSIPVDMERLEAKAGQKILRKGAGRQYMEEVLHDALVRLLLPSVRREIRAELKAKAYDHAIAGFADNLEHLLMARPLKGKVILSWDPGYRNGCKLAVLSPAGELLETQVVYPFAHGTPVKPEFAGYKKAVEQTKQLMKRHKVELVVIGNGTASRESVDLIASLLTDFPGVSYVIGSEAGASVYSASVLAKEEFPDLPVEERSAISIGRRIQDPLSELVKIDPQSLGIGEYQHDVPQKQLKETLHFVTDKAVNRVGVNVNTASVPLLQHVAGLKKPQIAKLIKARPIGSREEIAALLSDKVYEQSIGFLRIIGGQPLDNTAIHPESYPLARQVLGKIHADASGLRDPNTARKLAKLDAKQLARELNSDEYTVADIISELAHPGLDPRDALDGPVLLQGVLALEDLKPGMKLEGTVRNVTSFGAFVDIGLHEDGLVHISHMAKRFVKDPKEIVHVGQIVTVYVLEVDLRRKRIALSLVEPR